MTTPPPPPPRRGPTVTLHVRIRADLDRALRAYADQQGSNLTNTVEAALVEYLDRRGAHSTQHEGTEQQ